MQEAAASPGPRPRLEIIGGDGNAFTILGKMQRAAKAAGWSDERWEKVRDEATSGDYYHLLGTAMRHFDVVGPEDPERSLAALGIDVDDEDEDFDDEEDEDFDDEEDLEEDFDDGFDLDDEDL